MQTQAIATPSTALVVRNPIKAAVRLARGGVPDQLEAFVVERKRTIRNLEALKTLQGSLFGLERGLVPVIASQKKELAQTARQLESLDKLKQYAMFSLAPLTWRDKQGFPRLAVFSLDSPEFEISYVGKRSEWFDRLAWKSRITPKLPHDMAQCYSDVTKRLAVTAKKSRKTTRLRATFSGLIPEEARKQIIQAREIFSQIFIVAEVKQWDLEQSVIPRPTDPLVVGYDGKHFWLVTAFDPTSLEEFIARNFCAKVKPRETACLPVSS